MSAVVQRKDPVLCRKRMFHSPVSWSWIMTQPIGRMFFFSIHLSLSTTSIFSPKKYVAAHVVVSTRLGGDDPALTHYRRVDTDSRLWVDARIRPLSVPEVCVVAGVDVAPIMDGGDVTFHCRCSRKSVGLLIVTCSQAYLEMWDLVDLGSLLEFLHM